MIVALHTRLLADALDAYDRVHARVPADLLAALGEAGVRDWRIWRDGQDVFHVVDVEDYTAMRAALRDHPANVAWQAVVTPLQEVPDDYRGADTGLRFVWAYRAQAGGEQADAAHADHEHAERDRP